VGTVKPLFGGGIHLHEVAPNFDTQDSSLDFIKMIDLSLLKIIRKAFMSLLPALDDFQGLAANAGPAEREYEGQSFCSQMFSRIEPPFGGGAQRWKVAIKSLPRL